MKLTIHQKMYACLFLVPYFGYCITYGLPTTLEQAMYSGLYAGIIGIFVFAVFLFSLIVFGLQIPQIFKFKTQPAHSSYDKSSADKKAPAGTVIMNKKLN